MGWDQKPKLRDKVIGFKADCSTCNGTGKIRPKASKRPRKCPAGCRRGKVRVRG